MWSLYNNALVKLNSDEYAQKCREVTGTIRSNMSSIPQNLRLGMFASDADPFPVRYKSFELFPWQGHVYWLFENALEKTTAAHLRIIKSITSE